LIVVSQLIDRDLTLGFIGKDVQEDNLALVFDTVLKSNNDE